MIEQTCSDCGTTIDRPLAENANYVVGSRFTDTVEKEVHYALIHNDETKKRLNKMDRLLPERDRQALSAEMARPKAPNNVEVPAGSELIESDGGRTRTARTKEFPFSIPVEDFDVESVQSPNAVQDNDEVAYVVTVIEEFEKAISAVLCPDCTEDSDDISWGVDA